MQIRRARSFVLAQLRAYFENGGHRLSLTPHLHIRLSTHHVNSHNAHRYDQSFVYLMEKTQFALIMGHYKQFKVQFKIQNSIGTLDLFWIYQLFPYSYTLKYFLLCSQLKIIITIT